MITAEFYAPHHPDLIPQASQMILDLAEAALHFQRANTTIACRWAGPDDVWVHGGQALDRRLAPSFHVNAFPGRGMATPTDAATFAVNLRDGLKGLMGRLYGVGFPDFHDRTHVTVVEMP